MKTKIATVLFTLAAALGFTEEAPINQPSAILPLDLKTVEKPISKKSFGYVRMGVADSEAVRSFETLPGLGLGYRYALNHAALDVSANYTRQFMGKAENEESYFYTLPKVSYLRYWSNDYASQSFYYGAGLAFGGLKNTGNTFDGLVGNATVGYEMNRNQSFHSFVQLDVSQPTTRFSTQSWSKAISFANLPGPVAEVSFGLGF